MRTIPTMVNRRVVHMMAMWAWDVCVCVCVCGCVRVCGCVCVWWGGVVLHEVECTMVNHLYVPESRCTQGASNITVICNAGQWHTDRFA